jgi:catechol 2,3-dioxygenase-like lactoylglutathione lyase family enzyme
MPLQRLEHNLVLSDDIHGTRDFYRDVLGMAEGFRPKLDFRSAANAGASRGHRLKQIFLRDPNGVPIEINFRN